MIRCVGISDDVGTSSSQTFELGLQSLVGLQQLDEVCMVDLQGRFDLIVLEHARA